MTRLWNDNKDCLLFHLILMAPMGILLAIGIIWDT